MDGYDEEQEKANGDTSADCVAPTHTGNDLQTRDKTINSESNNHEISSKEADGTGNEDNNAGETKSFVSAGASNDDRKTISKEATEKSMVAGNLKEASFKEDKQDMDVPEDFFDDFLKEDFMAGLDIVDEDDEEQDGEDQSDPNSKPERKRSTDPSENKSKSHMEKIDHVKKFRESPPGRKLKKELKKVSDKKLKRLNAEVKSKKIEKSKSGIDADNFDIRRDPEKTREAIQRDKIRSAKDKEKRLITNIVETGLVPPGMELEVDIEEVCQKEKVEKNLPLGDLREKLPPKKTQNRNREKHRSAGKKRTPLSRKKSLSPVKKRRSRTPKRDSATGASAVLEVPGKEHIFDSDKNRSKSQRTPDRSLSRRSPMRPNPVLQHSSLSRRSPIRRSSPLQHLPRLHPTPTMRLNSLLHRSPIQRRGSRSRTPRRRSRTRSPETHTMRRKPLLHRSPIQRKGSRSRTPRRRSRTRSPALRRKSRSRSPRLLRKSRSRNRSPSYRRKRNRSYSPLGRTRRRRTRSRSPKIALRKEEKLSFLEELAAKLNEPHQMSHPPQATLALSAPVNYVLPTPPQQVITPVPAPAPVPPPPSVFFSVATAPVPEPQPVPPVTQQFNHYQQSFDEYDQSFFIGNSAPLLQQEEPSTVSREQQSNGYDTSLSRKKDGRLFGDKRIKLSDFLAITVKPQVSSSPPVKLQEKIKVIQQCQEAIKVLNERRFKGPLVVQKTDLYQSSEDMAVSPLLRKPVIQLPFATPGLKKSTEIDFTKCCETLLHRIGREKTLATFKESDKPNIIPPREVPKKEIAQPIFPIQPIYSEPVPKIVKSTKSFGTQTDKELSSCKECLRRKGILYANCGIQAGNPTLTFSVSTQVNEADFYSMIPKSQSLASLTPAQLLGKQSMLSDHSRVGRNVPNQDNMSHMNFQVPSPPPPPSFYIPPAPKPPQISQRDTSSYPSSLLRQPSLPSLMNIRPLFGDNKNKPPFPDNRRGGYNNRF